jgi:hypothetical protein
MDGASGTFGGEEQVSRFSGGKNSQEEIASKTTVKM